MDVMSPKHEDNNRSYNLLSHKTVRPSPAHCWVYCLWHWHNTEIMLFLFLHITEIDCGPPVFNYPNFPSLNTTLEGGNVIGNSYGYQNVVYFTCNEGRTRVGAVSAHCKADETWSLDSPKCKGKDWLYLSKTFSLISGLEKCREVINCCL